MSPMSLLNGHISCLEELRPTEPRTRAGAVHSPPACDFAEARVWTALGGGWQCLYGCYCQCGVSIEWHEFARAEDEQEVQTQSRPGQSAHSIP